jgi:hypothetical protein
VTRYNALVKCWLQLSLTTASIRLPGIEPGAMARGG